MVMIIIINRNDVNSNQSPWGSEWGVGGGREKQGIQLIIMHKLPLIG